MAERITMQMYSILLVFFFCFSSSRKHCTNARTFYYSVGEGPGSDFHVRDVTVAGFALEDAPYTRFSREKIFRYGTSPGNKFIILGKVHNSEIIISNTARLKKVSEAVLTNARGKKKEMNILIERISFAEENSFQSAEVMSAKAWFPAAALLNR